jgi:hypothetical protein
VQQVADEDGLFVTFEFDGFADAVADDAADQKSDAVNNVNRT